MGESTHLCISRVGVKDIAEKLARDGDTGNDEAVNIIRVDNKSPARRIGAQFTHAIEVHQEGEKDLVGGGTVLEYPQKIRLEGDGGDVSGMKGEGGGGGGYR